MISTNICSCSANNLHTSLCILSARSDLPSQHLSGLIRSFEANLLSPSVVASEIGAIATITAAAYGSDRCLRLCRFSVRVRKDPRRRC